MELVGWQRLYHQLRKEFRSTVQRLELGMIDSVIVSYATGRTVWVRDPVMDWPDPNDYDDPRPDR